MGRRTVTVHVEVVTLLPSSRPREGRRDRQTCYPAASDQQRSLPESFNLEQRKSEGKKGGPWQLHCVLTSKPPVLTASMLCIPYTTASLFAFVMSLSRGCPALHAVSRYRPARKTFHILLAIMPAVQPFCTCLSHGCAGNATTDERGNPRRGKRVGKQEYDEHRRADKRLKYLVRTSATL